MTDDFRPLGPAEMLPDNYVTAYYLEDLKHRVAVARVNGELHGFDDLCTHEACPLSSGLLTGTTIMCQCHGSRFDVTTGAVINGPATEPLGVYEAREVDGEIQARIPNL
jgi:3-phenylpropionate/trans-cinnamate dioxygenase ferredoxin component